jgi:hypothetical protein
MSRACNRGFARRNADRKTTGNRGFARINTDRISVFLVCHHEVTSVAEGYALCVCPQSVSTGGGE